MAVQKKSRVLVCIHSSWASLVTSLMPHECMTPPPHRHSCLARSEIGLKDASDTVPAYGRSMWYKPYSRTTKMLFPLLGFATWLLLRDSMWLHQAPMWTLKFFTSLVAYLHDIVLFFFDIWTDLGAKPLFFYLYSSIVSSRTSAFHLSAEVQFSFVSFDRVLIILSLDSFVFCLGILKYISLSSFRWDSLVFRLGT